MLVGSWCLLLVLVCALCACRVSQTAYGDIQLEVFDVRSVRQADIAFLAVSGAFSEQYARALCAEGGPVVIDMSSAFRYDDNVPLVVRPIVGAKHNFCNTRSKH